MMLERQDHTISRRLTWMNMLVSGAALLLACTAFIAYDMVTFRANMFRNLSTQAQIIGANTASALLFNDPQSAENTLSALKASPEILSASIYTPDGKPFATYSRDQNQQIQPLPATPPGQAEIHWLKHNEIAMVRLIVFQGKPTAIVYIRSGVQELNQRLERYAGIAAIVLLASMLAALLISSVFRRSVAEPIVRLAEIAKIVSRDRNYSLRATPTRGGSGELAVLIDAFNEMLAQTQKSEGALRQAHDQLEQRVQERTAELEAAKKEVEEFSYSVVRAKEEIERASKFKDQFLSTMSHELRTPLNAVLGFSDLLTEERYGPLNERQQRYVAHIHTGGKHLLTLINDILDLSKIEAGRLQLAIENVALKTSFAEVLDTMRPLADKKSHILVSNAAAELGVLADSTRLKQVLMNLIGNAIKFTPEGGRIELAARKTGDVVRLEVRDSGAGIPPEEQERIFEAFYRLRQTGKAIEGTGLGLAITQRLVELQGGKLGLESELGKGSCFYFTLPAVPSVEDREKGKTDTPIIPSGSARVLVLEDDPVAAHLLETHLISVGYEVVLCTDSAQAVEMAAKLQPHAITMDIIMKPLNGWELLSTLKTDPRTERIPVIVVSIVDQPTTGALLGADEYIVKPVEKATLLLAIDRCMERHGRSRQKRPILVVDDDAPTREFIAELLVKHGYVVGTAGDAAEARARVEASLPDLVILDLILPEVSGFQLLNEWRQNPQTADLPVFVLTSKDLTPPEREYLQTHAGALFRKQEPWQDALLRQLSRAVPPMLVGKS
jgi:signal transduction histidine kinase/DNA-binding response OmpR family regulator